MGPENVMAASLHIIGGQGILKKQKFVQKSSKNAENWPGFCSSLNEFLYILKFSMDDMTSEDVYITLLGLGLIKFNTVSANFN